MVKFDRTALVAALANNAALPANCFTVGRFGEPTVGIELSLDRGTDEFRPFLPHILVGGYRIHRDAYKGCLYEPREDGKTATVRRADLRECTARANGKVFYTLTQPETEKVGRSVVKVDNRLPYAKGPIVMNNHELRLWAGVVGGKIIGVDGWEALVELGEGEALNVFFEDGAVRRFVRQGSTLEERFLSSKAQLDVRIEEAWNQLDRVTSHKDGARERTIFAILSGMADLLHVTTRFDARGLGQEMRVNLIRTLFLELAPEALALCHRKVVAILHQVDPSLIGMMSTGSFLKGDSTQEQENVVDLGAARERAKREADREARRQERLAQQPKKGPSGGKTKVTSNPRKLAKQQRKQG